MQDRRRKYSSNDSPIGASTPSSGCPATASTASWKGCGATRTGSASSSSTTRRRPRSWPPGYAKSTGKLGVCLATSGPGAIHLLNGLYDAKLDHAPVLAITGMQETQMLGTGYQQEVALEKLFIDVAEYNEMIHVPAQLPTLVDIAIRHALTRRGVAHLTIPTDIQIADAGANPWSAPAPAVNQPTAPIYLPASGLPRHEDVAAAAEVLNAGSKVVMLVGAGALHAAAGGARDGRSSGAARSSRPCPGKAVVPDDHPLSIGGIGLLGTAPAEDAMEGCDTLFMVGTNFPYTKYLPEPGQCKVVQIEADPIRAGNRIADGGADDRPTPRKACRRSSHISTERSDRTFLEKMQKEMDDWREQDARHRVHRSGSDPAAVPDGRRSTGWPTTTPS